MAILVLSEAREPDLDSVRLFIAKCRSEYIISHSLLEQEQAAERGLFFKVVDEYGDLAAIASVIQVENTPTHEMANALVTPRWRGIGLQNELILVRAATIVTLLGEGQQLVTAVNPANASSRHVVRKAGFSPCDDIIPGLLWGCGSCPHFKEGKACCCDCYALPPTAHRELVRQFLARGTAFTLTKAPDVTLELRCAAAISDRRRRILQAFVDGSVL